MIGAGVIIGCLPAHVFAQSLNAAVTDQLRTIDGIACVELRGTDPLSVFQGGLLSICSRATGVGSSPGASSSGGGAATPTSVPSVVKKRLEEASGEEDATETGAGEPGEATWEYGRCSVFVSGEYESLDRDKTTFEDGYDSDIWRLTAGADVRLTERSVVGAAFVGYDQNGDFDGGGDFDIDSLGVLAFGSFLPTDSSFIQVSGGYFGKSNDRKRVATFVSDDVTPFSRTGRPDADFDAYEFSTGILAGYDFVVRNVTLGPRIGLDWVYTDYDSYSERGSSGLELTFYDDDKTSLQTTVGLQGSAAFSFRYGVFLPQASLAWKHEFADDQRDINVSFVGDTREKKFTFQTDSPDRNFWVLNAGLTLMLPHGFQAFGNYRTWFGNSIYNSHAGTLGLRVNF